MTTVQAWDGTQWVALSSRQGPPGPPGPPGASALPSGSAGGGLAGSYPNPTIVKEKCGGLLAVQRIWGQNAANRVVQFDATPVYVTTGTTTPLAISYTPSVECIWEVHASIGQVQSTDAAYRQTLAYLRSYAAADLDGFYGVDMNKNTHRDVQTYVSFTITAWLRLRVGVAYVCDAHIDPDVGTLQYHQGPEYLWMHGKVWAL